MMLLINKMNILRDLMFEHNVLEKLEDREPHILFTPGQFDTGTVQKIIAGEEGPKWIKLYLVRNWTGLPDIPPRPVPGAGLVFHPIAEKWLVYQDNGEVLAVDAERIKQEIKAEKQLGGKDKHQDSEAHDTEAHNGGDDAGECKSATSNPLAPQKQRKYTQQQIAQRFAEGERQSATPEKPDSNLERQSETQNPPSNENAETGAGDNLASNDNTEVEPAQRDTDSSSGQQHSEASASDECNKSEVVIDESFIKRREKAEVLPDAKKATHASGMDQIGAYDALMSAGAISKRHKATGEEVRIERRDGKMLPVIDINAEWLKLKQNNKSCGDRKPC